MIRLLSGLCFLAHALVGCVGDANPVRDAVNAAGIGPKPVAAPDFVAGSRPAGLDYLPVGVSAPPRESRARSADSVKSLEAELVASRGRNEARGREAGRVGAPKPAGSP